MGRRAGLAALCVLYAGCSLVASAPAGERGAEWTDTSPHESKYAEVNGVRLNYLDWGGDGPPLVLVHGLGDDPHIFDDLAGELRDQFRIVAYARRGHGQSDAPSGPYDAATLVEDLHQLLNQLEIKRASLLGWSMGGNEISDLARQYPDRVDKLVYLEGAYDWSDPPFAESFPEMLSLLSPSAAEVRSLDAFRDWFQNTWLGACPWSPGLEAYLRDLTRIGADGSVGTVPNGEVGRALLNTIRTWHRDYSRIEAPVLAIYSTVFFPTDRADLDLRRKLRQFEREVMSPFRNANMERLRRELPRATVQRLPDTTHMSVGVRQPKTLAAAIREFLTGRRA
jgi:pimeloyl-ACP methyl ester carboxylesterase